ncbi:MAG: MFS transporter [Oscillospiraceae bacterium]
MRNTAVRRIVNLAVGTVVMLFLGLIYAWSVFAAPLENTFGWARSETSLTFTISIAFFVIGLIVCGFLSAKLPKWSLMLLSAAFLLAGFLLCSRITQTWQLYLFYGVFVGFGVGVANNALVSSIVAWFPERRGIASGILMMGFGLGGLLLTNLAQWLMERIGWQTVFFWFGIAFAVIVGLGSLVVGPVPKELSATGQKAASSVKDVPLSKVLAGAPFWLYIVWFTLVMAGGLMVIGHASNFAQDLGATPAFGALAAGILSLFNGIGRILTGIVCDKKGLKLSMRLSTIYMFVAAALLVAAAWVGNIPLLIVGYIITGLCYGSAPTTSSIFASSFYGTRYFSTNYAVCSAAMIPGAVLGPLLAGNLRESSGGYLTSFVAVLAFSVVAFVVLTFIRKPAAQNE